MSREEQTYAIRFSRRARLDLDEAHVCLADYTDADHANSWYNGFLDALAALADNPNRHPVASETRFFQGTVYVYLYRLTARSAGSHVFFAIIDDTADAPYVYIIHIRHASRKLMTRAEARIIEAV